MYHTLKKLIPTGGYKFADMQAKIKKLYAYGDLNESQTEELLALAGQCVSKEGERPDLLESVKRLAARVEALEKAVALNGGQGEADEIPDWEPWDGISDKYQYGAVVRHNGTLWQSLFYGQNVWEPGVEGVDWLWSSYLAE